MYHSDIIDDKITNILQKISNQPWLCRVLWWRTIGDCRDFDIVWHVQTTQHQVYANAWNLQGCQRSTCALYVHMHCT